MPSKEPVQTFTYQTRLSCKESLSIILDSCAKLLSRVERKLFAEMAKGKKATDLKSQFIKEFGITARQFNAIRLQLEGKIASIKELRKFQILQIKDKIGSIEKRIKQLEKKKKHINILHQKRRLLFHLKHKLEKFQVDHETEKISLCFGSKHLFRAQFNLEKNGYQSREEWLMDWQNFRNNSFFLLGSKDESGGNQSCTATLNANGNLSLRIRLPDSLSTIHGKYLLLPEIHFKYGHEKIVEALKFCDERKRLQALKSPNAREAGLPISYRFKCDKKGWRVFASLPIAKAPLVSSSNQGAIGIDINANHLAIAESDRFGNPIAKQTIPLNTYGKNPNQTKAAIGDACTALVALAKKKGKTLVIEDLDFRAKKAELKEQNSPSRARMLSSLSYSHIKNSLKSKAWREGIKDLE